MRFLRVIGHLIIVSTLTVITQVGGLIWLMALLISTKLKKKKRYVFPILYLIFNLLLVPPVAKSFGRETLPVFNPELEPINIIYPLLFRNYTNPELKQLLVSSSEKLKNKNIKITYLDANFRFFDGFPLLPHLSHNDGKKVDIAFMYFDEKGVPTNKKPAISGYGAYIKDKNKTTSNCIKKGYWQYDFPKYLTFGSNDELTLDKAKTKALIKELATSNLTEKIFLEPYLTETLGLSGENNIRFHGCKAVRHDDHIHLQIK